MREHLFRAKRADNGEWIEGDLVHSKTTSRGVITEIYTLDFRHEVLPETVGEYTGRKDLKGRKVFEGDIVRGVWLNQVCESRIIGRDKIRIAHNERRCSVVGFDSFEGYYVHEQSGNQSDIHLFQVSEIEVIGNIHENPELLEAKS